MSDGASTYGAAVTASLQRDVKAMKAQIEQLTDRVERIEKLVRRGGKVTS